MDGCERPRLVVGISGATGIAYGVQTLRFARRAGMETHLVVTPAAQQTREYETDLSVRDLRALAAIRDGAIILATRCHPDVGRGSFHYPKKVSDQLAVYLSLYPGDRRPVKGGFENGRPPEIQEQVLARWTEYGYAGTAEGKDR